MSIQKKGGVYYVVTPYRDATGKKKNKWTRTDATSEAQAKKIERRLLTDLERGDLVFTKKQTLSAYFDKWLDYIKTEVRIGTVKKYTSHVVAAKNVIGDNPLDKITGMHIQEFLTVGRVSGLNGNYLYDQYATLKRALDTAVTWGLIPKNPAAGIKPPKKEKPTRISLTPKQVEIICDLIHDSDLYIPILLGTFGGLRRGEICGLRWVDIDTVKMSASIENSLDVHDGKYILGDVKTDASEDVIPLPEFINTLLIQENKKQKRQKLELGPSYVATVQVWDEDNKPTWKIGEKINIDKQGYVWAWEDGKPHNPDYLYKKFKKMLRAYNKTQEKDEDKLPEEATIHSLRHTHATLLLRAHVDLKVVSKKLRHTDFRFTAQVYQHVQEDIMRETADAMEIFNNKRLENRLETQKSRG